MSQTNVIITSGSKNQIIRVPVVNQIARSITPNDNLSSGSTSVSVNRKNNNSVVSVNHNSGDSIIYLSSNKSSPYSPKPFKSDNNKNSKNDNSFDDDPEIKTIYFNNEESFSNKKILLPTDSVVVKEEEELQELEDDEEYEDMEGSQMGNSKTQYKCSGCGKRFCFIGWLDRHKLSSPACLNADAIPESNYNFLKMCSQSAVDISNKSLDSKSRPSLEGRLDKLLACPNENCTFTTHWMQSLNKHVYSACKYYTGPDPTPVQSTAITCQVCGKLFHDSDEHIQHMKTSHQIKLLYQCSECGMNFANKYQSEAHVVEHNRTGMTATGKLVSKNLNTTQSSMNENEIIDQQVWNCKCGKNYLSLRAYEIHCTSCSKALSPQTVRQEVKRSQNSPQPRRVSDSALPVYENEGEVRHFRREQIEALHNGTDDFICKLCNKELSSSYGLCNHLSRRPSCREWYISEVERLFPELTSGRNRRKQRYQLERPMTDSRTNSNRNSTDSSSHRQPNTFRQKPKRLVITQSIRRKSQDNDNSFGSSQISLNNRNSISCQKCNKMFVGKNPNVALTNHLRGTTCSGTYNSSQNYRSRGLGSPNSMTSNPTNKALVDIRFYCKLCPRIELKNRVSLGCHLTIYHGLPQVNVSTDEGDAYRCQTCSQVFPSKYFYNVHRHECDKSSPYIGYVSDSEDVPKARTVKRSYSRRTSLMNHFKPKQLRTGSQEAMSCDLCGKIGFANLNSLNIHQKYQCVRRDQITSNKTHANINRFQNQSKLKPTSYTSGRSRPKPGPGGKVYLSELAKLNDMAKKDTKLTMCDSCGRGPYNSYYYFLEHKKKFCLALKGKSAQESTTPEPKIKAIRSTQTAKKAVNNDTERVTDLNESFCLEPTIPRARKTMNFANVTSPQVSRDSSSPAMNCPEGDVEEALDPAQIIKCTICFDDFDDVLLFIRHRLNHITSDIMHNEPAEPLKCELCGAEVNHYQRIQQHLILHLQNVQIIKKKSFIELKPPKRWRNDNEESDEETENDNPVLSCPYCKSQYNSRLELADHIRNTCPFRYQCPNCGKTYSAKESFLDHKELCTKNATSSKSSKGPLYKCRNCDLEFRIKQHLLWHEDACVKIFTADHSGQIEAVIERTLSCSVCGLISDSYESKVKHESKCLKRYLGIVSNITKDIDVDSDPEDVIKPLSVMDFDLRSLSNASESSILPEELMKNLKEEFGIQKEIKVVLTAFDEDIVRKVKNELYGSERDESSQLESLKDSFLKLVRRLIKDDEVLQGISEESGADVLLARMLKYLGEEPIEANGLTELSCFRQNLQTFLKLTIKDDTLVLAYKDAESVDEAIINMLNFECELNY